MKPPTNILKFENANAMMWFDRSTLCFIAKPRAEISKSTIDELINFIKSHSKGKICWLCDVSEASMPSRDLISFAHQETAAYLKAIAFITPSAVSRRISEMYLLVHRPIFPTKVFATEVEAREWLKQF